MKTRFLISGFQPALAALLFFFYGLATGQERATPPDLSYLSLETVTPHIAWARPLAGGPVKVLALVSGKYQMRELVELKQRFDFEISSSLFYPPDQWHRARWSAGFPKLKPEALAAGCDSLLAEERRYDVILISGNVWDWLSKESRESMDRRVRAGTGLVWVNPCPTNAEAWNLLPVAGRDKPKRVLLQDVAVHDWLKPMPREVMPGVLCYSYTSAAGAEEPAKGGEADCSRIIITGQHSKGRVVVLAFDASSPDSHAGVELYGVIPRSSQASKAAPEYPYWDHFYGLVGRAVLWAGAKDPPARFVAALCPEFNVNALDQTSVQLSVESQVAGDFTLRALYQNDRGEVVETREERVRLARGKNSFQHGPRQALAGAVVGNYLLSDEHGAHDWTSVVLTVNGPARISRIALVGQAFQRSGSAEGKIELASGSALAGLTVKLQLKDGLGRELAVATLPVEGQDVPFRMQLGRALSMRGRLYATLLRDTRPIHDESAEFVITPAREWDDYEVLIWDGEPQFCIEHLHTARMAEFSRMGITAGVVPRYRYTPAFLNAMLDADLKFCTRMAGYGRGLVLPPVDPEKSKRDLASEAAYWAPYGPMANQAGDEQSSFVTWKDGKMLPQDLSAFQAWLKTEYKDLNALNEQWATDFADWNRVAPAELETLKGRTNNFGPWSDLTAFAEHRFADTFRQQNEAMLQGDPEMRNGISGTQNCYDWRTGYDWWRLMSGNAFRSLQGYGGGDQLRVQLSFTHIPQLYWSGYGRTGQDLIDDMLGHMWYGLHGTALFNGSLFLNPDLTWNDRTHALKEACDLLRRGMGKLLIHSEYVFDQIAIHYSQRSIHGMTALGRAPDMEHALDGIGLRLMKAAGFETKYVAYAQIEEGQLTPDRFRLFIMAHSIALSPREAEAVRRFVQAGGIVLADLLTGVMDDHCRTLAHGQLDDVFGIRRAPIKPPNIPQLTATPDGQVIALEMPAKPLPIAIPPDMPVRVVDESVQPAGAIALAEEKGTRAPMFLVHRFGKGWAVLVNGDTFNVCVYPPAKKDPEEKYALCEKGLAVLLPILKAAGCEPAALVVNSAGIPVATQMVRLFSQGKNLYAKPFGLPTDRGPLTLRLRHKAHVFEMSTGQYLGEVDRFPVPTPGAGADSGYALLAYRPRHLKVASPKECQRGADFALRITIEAEGQPDLHVVRMDVFAPDGKPAAHYAQNALCRQGSGEVTIPFALNDGQGDWRLSFRDIATGLRAEHRLRLEEKK